MVSLTIYEKELSSTSSLCYNILSSSSFIGTNSAKTSDYLNPSPTFKSLLKSKKYLRGSSGSRLNSVVKGLQSQQ
jgi:hypothetical protein